MHRITGVRFGILALSAAAIAACGPGAATTAPTAPPVATQGPAPTSAPATQGAAGLELGLRMDAEYGDIVTGKDGLSLYVFEHDANGKSACNGDCAGTWPPLTVAAASDVTAGSGINGALGTITRDDGSLQVTIAGHPVYYYAGDTAAGDTNGEGLFDLWYLVSPAGGMVEESGGSETPGASTCSGPTCY